ncbi:tail fiber domain-containing protein [Staphylococcus felis]|uniref:Tail fiber domain-containing protein n=1 Tax=Staphylococcus felis TaxID=46127 RepID=A0ABS0QNQ5_9STAP|nr:tail fiber domain-containing protein [Staphylococcus felis]MBH9580874.1 tail fiber domain-containing protein [Staphylococcus felis]
MAKLSLFTKLSEIFNTYSISQHEKNYKEIERWANSTDEDMKFHRNSEKNAHKSVNIEHDLTDEESTNVSQELKYQRSQILELILGHNGDGIQELRASRVAMDSSRLGDLSNRLYYDFTFLKNDYIKRITELKNSLDYYVNIKSIGALGDDKTDNKDIFINFNDNQIYYVPLGTYKTSELPKGLFFGKGTIKYNDEVIPISQHVAQKVRVNVDKKTVERYQNFTAGQNTATKQNQYSYANTGVGYSVFKDNIQGRRLTGFGKGALSNMINGYSNEAFGSDALGQGNFGNRNTAIGANALKWGGSSKPVETLHDFWKDKGEENFVNKYFKRKWSNVWSVLGNESGPLSSIIPRSDSDLSNNVAIGRNALVHLMKGNSNTAIGYNSQAHTIDGNGNTSIGDRSLRDNLVGSRNSALGMYALTNNITGKDNVAIGANNLQQTLHASNNTAIGYGAMHFFKDDKNHNTNSSYTYGYRNTAIGTQSMQDGKNASYSVMVGSYSGRYTEGEFNVGVGAGVFPALKEGNRNVGIGGNTNRTVAKGNDNVAIGYTAGPNADYSNTVSIGANAHANGNNQIQIGSSDHTVYTFNSIRQRSDKRNKENIKETTLGLDFINKVRAVDYNFKGSDELHHGVIAQEIEDTGYIFGGVQNAKYEGGEDIYTVSYTELIAPLIKSVQELTMKNKLLHDRLDKIENGGIE